jgi:hypothetical protein
MFQDPVFTSVGNTYDRGPLLSYWEVNGTIRDPLTGRLCSRAVTTNWDKRREVEEFLATHPAYTPEGWSGRSLMPTPRELLPGGFVVEDVVVSLIDFRGEDKRSVSKGDVGIVIGEADVDPNERVRCKFPNEPKINMFPREITRRNLPGGYVVGDVVVSLVSPTVDSGISLARGDIGAAIGEATDERETRLLCKFPREPRISVHPEEITKLDLPGGYRVGDSIVSLINFRLGDRSVSKGDIGVVVGSATVEHEFRVRCRFPNEPSINVYPREIARRRRCLSPQVCCHRVVRRKSVRLEL